MTSTVELAGAGPEFMDEAAAETTVRPEGRTKRIVTGLGLAAIGGAASYFEFSGKMVNWHPVVDEIGTSLRHPLLGYAAAWAVTRKSRKHRFLTALAAATATDLIIEGAEPLILDSDHDPFEPFSQASQLETLKDYWSALGGMALFQWQNRLKRVKP